jgi:palmitoyltransferase
MTLWTDANEYRLSHGLCDGPSMVAAALLVTILGIAVISPMFTFGTLLVFLPLLAIVRHYLCPRLVNTNFYASWATSSFLILIYTFEFQVVPYLEILLYENLILVSFATLSILCTIYVRSQSSSRWPTNVTGSNSKSIPIPSHVSWLNANLTPSTRPVFIVGCLSAIAALIYGSQLTATTICHPIEFHDMFLVPDDCSDVYNDLVTSFAFVTAIYELVLALVLILEVLGELLTMVCPSKREVAYHDLKTNEC